MKKIIFVFLIIILLSGCQKENMQEEKLASTFKDISGEARVLVFTIYGRFFNLEGEIDGENKDLTLVMRNSSNDEEVEYKVFTRKEDNKTIFKTNELINDGINLEQVLEGNYILFLKSTEDEKEIYYTLNNKTDYKDLEYYTITKNSSNRKINIKFNKYQDNNYMSLDCLKSKLPKNIYDIVLDPGHGGKDVGANKNGKYESQINLDYALSLKSSLEKLGLRVKLTREKDVSIPNYGEDGRVNFAYETRAKLFLSIHQNSAIYNVQDGGVEVYVPNHANTSFAESVVKNIVDMTSTTYSKNKSNKVKDGVYMRTLSATDIEDMQKEALKNGYEPYDKASTDSTYYFIIRETGGIVSGAYVDSRNKEKPWNNYYDSNYGSESYLFELGYINSSSNLDILVKEKDKYVEAITKSIKDYLEI